MTVLHVELVPEFDFGDDVVLLAMDTAGVEAFLTPLRQAEQHGLSRMDHGGITHEFSIEPGAADIELHDDRVVWRFDQAKAAKIIEMLTGMSQSSGAGHYYVDISEPARTLVISHNEWTSQSFPLARFREL
ncbi:hypothetical protein [Mycobacterium hubeiense]|uniref:hypothetical protein n=1 Tax=Mycobacterium hubeiense TaxID=1867256 RepID=UPI000C7EE7E0|nr:hypothetical protein [Mycobacterium sp. QGD 101]